MAAAIRLGFMTHNEGAGDPRRIYADTLELFAAAEQLGFDVAWVAQHHFRAHPGRLPSPFPFLAAASQRTQRLRLGTAVVLLPLEEPAVALPAPKVITVAEMAGRIRERLLAQAWISFDDLLSLAARRVEVVVALWSVLELLKRRAIVVDQEQLFGPIMIGRGTNLTSADLHELEVQDSQPDGH